MQHISTTINHHSHLSTDVNNYSTPLDIYNIYICIHYHTPATIHTYHHILTTLNHYWHIVYIYLYICIYIYTLKLLLTKLDITSNCSRILTYVTLWQTNITIENHHF